MYAKCHTVSFENCVLWKLRAFGGAVIPFDVHLKNKLVNFTIDRVIYALFSGKISFATCCVCVKIVVVCHVCRTRSFVCAPCRAHSHHSRLFLSAAFLSCSQAADTEAAAGGREIQDCGHWEQEGEDTRRWRGHHGNPTIILTFIFSL